MGRMEGGVAAEDVCLIATGMSTEEDFKVITLDGEKAKVRYLALKARLIELASSIPTSVPVEPEE